MVPSLGLRPVPLTAKDKRFSLTRHFGAPSLDLPKQYDVEDDKGDVAGPREQGENFCTAYTLSEIGSDEHGIPMSGDFQAMLISLVAGYPIHTMGATIKTAMKSGNLFGFLPAEKAPFTWKEKGEAFICDPASWSKELMAEAEKYRMPGGYFLVDGPHDAFDNFRAQLYQHKPDNGIAIGLPWYESFNDTPGSGIVPAPAGGTAWHAIDVKGLRRENGVDVLRVRSWSGRRFGKKSYGFFTREVFNAVMAVAGAEGRMFKDVSEDTVRELAEERHTISEVFLNFFYKLQFAKNNPMQFNLIVAFMDFIAGMFNRRPESVPAPEPTTPPAPPVVPVEPPKPPESKPTPPPAPKPAPATVYDFSTPKKAYHSVRALCDEMGLPFAKTIVVNGRRFAPKDVICGCVYQESGFKNSAKYQNRDPKTKQVWSTDWGIVQINDHYHIGLGKDFPSVAYVLAHPEKAVRYMIRMYQAGKLSLWSSYKSGDYAQWLSPGSPMWDLAD